MKVQYGSMATHAIPTGAESNGEPIPKDVLRRVYKVGRAMGYDLPDVEDYEVPEYADDMASGGLTPYFLHDGTQTAKAIWTGVATPFSWKEAVDEAVKDTLEASERDSAAFEESGKAHMTTTFVRAEKTIEETVEHLCETLQVDMAAKALDGIVADDVDPVEVTFYAIAVYAKGWLAERILTSHERFGKGSQGNDERGQDVYDNERQVYRQVRPVTNRENDYDNCLYYQWTCRGELVFGDDFKEVNKEAGKKSGRVIPYTGEITPTETLRGTSKTFEGRPYRYLWW